MRKIILASASPRRKQLLENIGLNFVVEESNFPEDLTVEQDPVKLTKFLSSNKAKTVAKNHKDAIVIGADTVALFGKEIIGKPKDKADSKRILRKLSGKKHIVITSFTVIDAKTGKTITKSSKANVWFGKMTKEEIEWYGETGEPMGKGGGYAVQQRGGIFVNRVEGDFFTVVGLPVYLLIQTLKEFGVFLSEKI